MKKLLLSFLVGLTLFLSFTPYLSPVKAQTWYSQDPIEWYLKVYDQSISPGNEIFGERYTAAQVQWIFYSILFTPVRILESVVGEHSITCFMKVAATGTVDFTGCIGIITDFVDKIKDLIPAIAMTPNNSNQSMLAAITNTSGRDISGIGYTKSLLNKLSPVSKVEAQGYGYAGIAWIQDAWRGFRNISYALLVLVTIVFAFMIMFRVKLSPQTVISVQSALPKIVVAMILITFSYAIAGFAIDLMYVVAGLFALLLQAAGFSTNINAAWGTISGTGFGYALAGGLWILFEMIGYTILFFIAVVWIFLTMIANGFNIFGMLLTIIFVFIVVWLIVLCIWYTFKIPYVMIKTLISIYLSIITAPVQLLAGTIVPSMGFSAWFRRLMADILVFPVIGLLIWFAWATLWQAYTQTTFDVGRFWNHLIFSGDWVANAWVPEIIGSRAIGGHNTGLSGIIMLAISFGIITMIPKVPELLKSVLLGEKFSFGSAIGEAWGAMGTAYGATGARDIVGMYGKTSRALSMQEWAKNYGTPNAGWVSRQISGLENKRFIGKPIRNTMQKMVSNMGQVKP